MIVICEYRAPPCQYKIRPMHDLSAEFFVRFCRVCVPDRILIGDPPSARAKVSAVANRAPLAQLAEQRTLNPRVRGSSPWRRTI